MLGLYQLAWCGHRHSWARERTAHRQIHPSGGHAGNVRKVARHVRILLSGGVFFQYTEFMLLILLVFVGVTSNLAVSTRFVDATMSGGIVSNEFTWVDQVWD